MWIIYQNFYVAKFILQKKKKTLELVLQNWNINFISYFKASFFTKIYIYLDNQYIGKNNFTNLWWFYSLSGICFLVYIDHFLKNISKLNAFIFLYLQVFINFKEFQNSSCQDGLSVTIILQKSLNANEVSDCLLYTSDAADECVNV